MNPTSSFDRVAECADIVRARWPHSPRVGIVLGTGLGDFVQEMKIVREAHPNMGDVGGGPKEKKEKKKKEKA